MEEEPHSHWRYLQFFQFTRLLAIDFDTADQKNKRYILTSIIFMLNAFHFIPRRFHQRQLFSCSANFFCSQAGGSPLNIINEYYPSSAEDLVCWVTQLAEFQTEK